MTAPILCSGCALVLPDQHRPHPARFNASGECEQLYHELSFYTLAHPSTDFIHQTAVDAYAAQHVGAATKPITTVFSLVGLCLALEHGYTGRQVQRAHMALAQQENTWLPLQAPAGAATVTVLDVLLEDPGPKRDAALQR